MAETIDWRVCAEGQAHAEKKIAAAAAKDSVGRDVYGLTAAISDAFHAHFQGAQTSRRLTIGAADGSKVAHSSIRLRG